MIRARVTTLTACLSLLAVLLCLTVFSAVAEEPRYQLVLHSESMAPYNYQENGQALGINIDIAKRLFDMAGVDYRIEFYPWSRAFMLSKERGNGALVSTARYEDRIDQFKWVGPLASSKACLYKLKSRADIVVNTLNDVKKYRLAVVRGDVYEQVFIDQGWDQSGQLIRFDSSLTYQKLIFEHKIDLIIGSELLLPYALSTQQLDYTQLVPVIDVHSVSGNYIALNKEVPDNVVAKLNQQLMRLKSSGEFTKIIKKYHMPWLSAEQIPENCRHLL